MSNWKTWAGLVVLTVLAIALYPRRPAPRATGGKQKQTIVLWANISLGEAMRTAIEEFERENPDYKVQLGAATVRDVYADPTRFLLGVAGGVPPDAIAFDRYAVIEWASRGAFTDLTPYLQADAKRPDGVHRADFFAPAWNEASYKNGQYAIPNGCDIRALYLNDDLLVRAGFVNADGSVRPPQSWEDICAKRFHGTGSVTAGGVVRLGQPLNLPGVGPFPITPGPLKPGDVVTLRSGQALFRARIATLRPDGAIQLDFTRDLPANTTAVPAEIVGVRDLEVKVFDGNSYAIAMTRYDAAGNIDVLGFSPLAGNSFLYMYGWENGATFLSPDENRIELDQPEAKVALQYMVDCYDAIGGYALARRFDDSQKGSPRSPFINGKMAMAINGNWYLSQIAAYSSDLRFTLVPAPIPRARLRAGAKPITWMGGDAYAIPATAKNKDGAWKLIRFLSSEKSHKIQFEVNGAQITAAGQLYIPGLPVRPGMVPWVRETYVTGNAGLNERLARGFDVFTALLPDSKFRPHTPVAQKLWEAQLSAGNDAIDHVGTVHEILTDRSRWAQEALDRYIHPPDGPLVEWKWLIAGYVVLLGIFAGFLARSEMWRRRAGLGQRDWLAGFTCVSPWLIGFIVFGGGPILFSLIISFCHYDVLNPARFVGLHNYISLLGFHTDTLTGHIVANDPKFWRSIANTAFMLLALPLSIVLGMLLAMLLNYTFRGIALFRTLFYLPSIMPAVASFLLWMWIFDPTRGVLNRGLMAVGVKDPPSWLSNPAWSKPALILMGLWGVGGGMLIWLAGLKAIPDSLYEAAEIDGASAFRRFTNVTLPMLSPYIFFNTVMGVIGTLQVFEAAYIMTDGGPNDSTLFYAYYLFNQAFRYLDMGAASAMAWILFAIVLGLTLIQLWLGRRWVHYD
jgi:multiple sugar transport system permease protein